MIGRGRGGRAPPTPLTLDLTGFGHPDGGSRTRLLRPPHRVFAAVGPPLGRRRPITRHRLLATPAGGSSTYAVAAPARLSRHRGGPVCASVIAGPRVRA